MNRKIALVTAIIVWLLSGGFEVDDAGRLLQAQDGPLPAWTQGIDVENLEPITAWNADRLVELARLGQGQIRDVAWSPDGETLAIASSIGVWLYDSDNLAHQPRLFEGHSKPVTSVAFSPDGSTLASGSWDQTVRLWDVSSGTSVATLEGHSNWVETIAFSPDGALLATGGGDTTVRLWNADSGELLHTFVSGMGSVVDIAFSPGDSVKIKEGPFQNFDGVVEEIMPDKGLVKVVVTIFGRSTPVELEYWQMENV